MEMRRSDPSQRSPEWDGKQKLKMEQGLDQLEKEAAGFGAGFDIGLMTIAIVLDYFDLVVHVFAPEQRAYYDLERLWGDAPTELVAEDATHVDLLREDAPARPAANG